MANNEWAGAAAAATGVLQLAGPRGRGRTRQSAARRPMHTVPCGHGVRGSRRLTMAILVREPLDSHAQPAARTPLCPPGRRGLAMAARWALPQVQPAVPRSPAHALARVLLHLRLRRLPRVRRGTGAQLCAGAGAGVCVCVCARARAGASVRAMLVSERVWPGMSLRWILGCVPARGPGTDGTDAYLPRAPTQKLLGHDQSRVVTLRALRIRSAARKPAYRSTTTSTVKSMSISSAASESWRRA